MKAKVWLIRHAETDWTASGRMQGQTDVSLSANGCRQARLLAGHLRWAGLRAIYCSDLQRAQQTAAIIGQELGLAPRPRSDLRERSYGAWEGLTVEEAKAQRPDVVAQWSDDFDNFRPPEGEGTLALRGRVLRAFKDILADNEGGRIALVGHTGPLKEILCEALGIPAAGRGRIQLAPTSATVLRFDGERAYLELLNDTCHLGGAVPEGEVD